MWQSLESIHILQQPSYASMYLPAQGVFLAAGVRLFGRPWEGLLLSAAAVLLLCWRTPPMRVLRAAAPAGTVLLCALVALGVYCRAVTFSPFRIPYALNQATYGWPMTLPWQTARRVSFRHAEMRGYYEWEAGLHGDFGRDPVGNIAEKAQMLWRFYWGPLLSLPFLMIGLAAKDRRTRPLFLVSGLMILVVLAELSGYPHYLSPATAALVGVNTACIRRFRFWRFRGRGAGRIFVAALPFVLLALLLARAGTHAGFASVTSWCCQPPGNEVRARIARDLTQIPGTHLVMVRYSRAHNPLQEWVYNEADIERARVVWAHEMDDGHDRALLEHFRNRRVWRIEADGRDPRLASIR